MRSEDARIAILRAMSELRVVLVHGTWARGSRWPKVEAMLADTFAGRAHVEYVEWPGHNQVSARMKGVRALIRALRSSIRAHPDARHVVIAHSHGGNVALRALRARWLQRRVAGLVCLSTPFLVARHREIGENAQSVLIAAINLLVTLAVGIEAERHPALAGTPAGILKAVMLGAGALAMYAIPRGTPRFLRRIAFASRTEVPALLVRSPADEASLSLAFVQAIDALRSTTWKLFMERIPGFFSRPVRRALGAIRGRIGVVGMVLAGVVIWAGLGAAVGILSPGTSLPLGMLVAAGLVLVPAMLPLTVAALVAVPTVLINILAFIPFGFAYAVRGPFLEVTAESTPPGRWSVHQLQFPDRDPETLRHSVTYQDARALGEIARWLRELPDRAPPRPPTSDA